MSGILSRGVLFLEIFFIGAEEVVPLRRPPTSRDVAYLAQACLISSKVTRRGDFLFTSDRRYFHIKYIYYILGANTVLIKGYADM